MTMSHKSFVARLGVFVAAMMTSVAFACGASPAAGSQAPPTPQAPPSPQSPPTERKPASQERVAAIKKSLAEGQAKIQKYEWIETTVVSLKGDEKATIQKYCHYTTVGNVEKVTITPPSDDKPAKGIRGKVKEKKKAELTGYLKDAADLVHQYIPPDPAKLQACMESGKTTIRVLEPGKRAVVEFVDYLKSGDTFAIEIDLVSNAILNMSVASWLENAKDAVRLNVKFDKLADGAVYTSESVLEGDAQKVKVVVTNTGFRDPKS